MMGLLIIIGLLYGLTGLASLTPVVMFLVFGPRLTWAEGGFPLVVAYGGPLLNAVVCCLVSYGLLTLRRWGRYSAIAYNGALLAMIIFLGLYARITERPELTIEAIVYWVLLGAFLAGVTVFCLSNGVRTLMTR